MAWAAESDATWSGRRPAAAAAFLGGGDVGDAAGFFGYLFFVWLARPDRSESAAASASFLFCHVWVGRRGGCLFRLIRGFSAKII